MALMKCRSCGGVYETDQHRSTKYFHACPPIELVTVDRLGVVLEVERKDVAPDDRELRARLVPRPGARDENVRVTGFDRNGTAETARKADGDGVDPVERPSGVRG
jgi:hypothetical protein